MHTLLDGLPVCGEAGIFFLFTSQERERLISVYDLSEVPEVKGHSHVPDISEVTFSPQTA